MKDVFWRTQSGKALFPEIEWSKPERRNQAGKLLIIGGSNGNFRAVATAYDTAFRSGAGQVRALMPDSLRKNIPAQLMSDVVFAPSNISGAFSNEALNDFLAASDWSDSIILIGDTNKNSETAILFETFLSKTKKPVLITRDAIDILMNSMNDLLNRENTTIVASFAQTQKIFQTVFYPKVLTFSMQLSNFAETLHKFTTTYPIVIVSNHAENLVISQNGKVVSTPFENKISSERINPFKIWNGEIPTKIAVYELWNPNKKMEAAASAILN